MKFNKKAMILYYPLLIAIALGFGGYYYASLTTLPDYGSEFVGEIPLKLIESIQKAEKSLIYTDQSAKYSAQKTIIKLAEKGGYIEDSGCGEYLRYSLWSALDEKNNLKECFPDSEIIKTNFILDFNENLNQYISNYPEADIPQNNYEIELKEEENELNVIALAINDIKIPIGDGEIENVGDSKINEDNSLTGAAIILTKKTEQSKFYGIYSIKPSFKVNTGNFLSDYEKLSKSSEELTQKCKDPENLILCLNENILDIFNKNNLELSENCETEEKQELLEFAEYFESCFDSEDKSCVCREKPNKKNYNIRGNDNKIIIEKDSSKDKISIKKDTIKISDDLFIKQGFYLHKDDNGDLLAQKDITTNPECSPKPKTKFRFCVKTNDINYKFALQFPQKKIIEQKKDAKELFENKRVVISVECKENQKESQEEIKKLAIKLGDMIAANNAQVIVPIQPDNCEEIEDTASFKNNYINNPEENILIIITAADEGMIEYKNTQLMALSIYNRVNEKDDFSENPKLSNAEILSITNQAVKITFASTQIKDNNIEKYSDDIYLGIVDYLS